MNKSEKKTFKKAQVLLALLLLFCIAMSVAGIVPEQACASSPQFTLDAKQYTLSNITSTDALGRELTDIVGYEEDKYVGLFYFLWLGQYKAPKVRNVTELLKTNYNDLFDSSYDNKVVPYDSWLHYNEPLYGYYNSNDEWVMRKHIEMFIATGIDFLVMDFTNAQIYWEPLEILMGLLREYKDAGWDVPQVSFYVNLKANELTRQLYERIYMKEEYKDLVFYGNYDKPMIISVPGELDADLKEFFHVRASQWHKSRYPSSVWPYWEIDRKWQKYEGMVSVSLAQASAFSYAFEKPKNQFYHTYGRGYSSKNPQNGNVDAILRGANFQEGWDAAIALNPEYVFITGWNEWVVQKIDIQKRFPEDHSKPFANYTDNFNVEFSRDIEMTKSATYVSDGKGGYTEEGYGDNYFLQLAENIRRYKGIVRTEENYQKVTAQTIDIHGSDDQWQTVQQTYLTQSSQKTARNHPGFYSELKRYKQAAPENFVKEVKVTYDQNNVYFRIATEQDITAHQSGKTNWMNLMIGIEGSKANSWENFQYVVNRNPGTDGKTSVEGFAQNGQYTFKHIGNADMRISGKVMQLQIPRSVLGIPEGKFRLTFKVTDSIEKPNEILDYYVSGESFPIGRLAYIFEPDGVVDKDPSVSWDGLGTDDSIQPGGDDSGDVGGVIQTNYTTELVIIIFLMAASLLIVGTTVGVVVIVRRKK